MGKEKLLAAVILLSGCAPAVTGSRLAETPAPKSGEAKRYLSENYIQMRREGDIIYWGTESSSDSFSSVTRGYFAGREILAKRNCLVDEFSIAQVNATVTKARVFNADTCLEDLNPNFLPQN